MSKDQAIGGLIFAVCVVLIVGYVAGIFFYDPYIKSVITLGSESTVRYWLVAIPVLIAFVAVLGIGAWIGWTMATTSPPKPIEENQPEETEEAEKQRELKQSQR